MYVSSADLYRVQITFFGTVSEEGLGDRHKPQSQANQTLAREADNPEQVCARYP